MADTGIPSDGPSQTSRPAFKATPITATSRPAFKATPVDAGLPQGLSYTPSPGATMGAPISGGLGQPRATYSQPAVKTKGQQFVEDTPSITGAAGYVLSQGGTRSGNAKGDVLQGAMAAGDAYAGLGPAAGAAGKVASKAAETAGEATGKLARGLLHPTEAAQALIDAGIDLPLGSMKGGFWKAAEEKTSSIPITGDFIRSAARRTLDSWNRVTIDQILDPIGKSLDKSAKVGSGLVENAGKKLDEAYEAVHKQVSFKPDPIFGQVGQALIKSYMDGGMIAQADIPRMNAVLKKHVLDELFDIRGSSVPGKGSVAVPKTLTGERLQRVRSELKAVAKKFSSSGNMSEQEIGHALQDMNALVGETLARQHPKVAERLKAVDLAYAKLVRVQEAAASKSTSAGEFTPADLLRSIKRNEGGVRNKTFAEGGGLMQTWATNSQEALAHVVANSGTVDRGLWASLLLGEGFGVYGVTSLGAPHYLAPVALAATSAPWTKSAIRGMNRLVRSPEAQKLLDQGPFEVSAALNP
jgi:hypothetical protein